MSLALATGWEPSIIENLTMGQINELGKLLSARNRGRKR
jgi:hypothetical protein